MITSVPLTCGPNLEGQDSHQSVAIMSRCQIGRLFMALETFETKVCLQGGVSDMAKTENIRFTVTEVSGLNLLGRDTIIQLGVDIAALLAVSAGVYDNIRWCVQLLFSRVSSPTLLCKRHATEYVWSSLISSSLSWDA